jgi:hypothetical protein
LDFDQACLAKSKICKKAVFGIVFKKLAVYGFTSLYYNELVNNYRANALAVGEFLRQRILRRIF